jgi:hypothetical protein
MSTAFIRTGPEAHGDPSLARLVVFAEVRLVLRADRSVRV